jgi:hypothetical protein
LERKAIEEAATRPVRLTPAAAMATSTIAVDRTVPRMIPPIERVRRDDDRLERRTTDAVDRPRRVEGAMNRRVLAEGIRKACGTEDHAPGGGASRLLAGGLRSGAA